LATEFGSMDALAKAGKSRLQQIETIGPTLGDAIHRWFSLKDNRVLVRRLQKEGIDPKLQRTGKRLEGKTLVITGSLESMNRDEAKEKIRLQGGRATSSVSARTDYLVVGSDPGDTKLRDARSAGVQTIDEKHFRKLVFAER
jgi:DNA ligase (NAD+)